MDRNRIVEISRLAAELVAKGPVGTRPAADYLQQIEELKKEQAERQALEAAETQAVSKRGPAR